ncbi:MAG TPA: TRAP transporter permease [Candidatus Mailhella excrementigallinarum]|nr:MAG: C4-dicarboxylate ABC transporter permease [Desulfovibrionaceae bacterium]HIV66170.1 TRAP transporter permease [Candidatus Mailhella excrementigallinarum]
MNKGSPDAAAQSIPPGKSVQPPADAETIPVLSPSPLAPDELAREQALAQTLVEEKDSESRTRMFSGPWANIVSALALAFSLFQLAASTFWTLDAITLRAVHILFLLTLSFLLYPALRREQRQRRAPTLYDALCICAGLFSFGYLVLNYTNITLRGGWFEPADYAVASVGLIVCFEMARRVVGNLAALALVFLAYNFFGYLIPGAFGHPGYSWNRVVEHMFWGSQGLLGVGVGVSATYIFLFVLFGAFLKYSGFSDFINDLALTLVGRTAGGPAKVSVIASALMGMINGSALANVATTGAITIPLMKKTGYRAEFAGAVEAVASTGGQFAPPIMGAVGFIMAEFLGVPYTTVMLAAAIPAFLYYFTLLMAVHFEARKLGLRGLSREHIPNAANVLKERGHLLLPLIALMALLFMGYTPLFAAAISIAVTVAASWLSPRTRMGLSSILMAMEEGARGAVGVGAACVIIGVIIGTVSLTGLGLTFGYEILKFVGKDQMYLGGLFVMIMSTILGMGVPGVAAYVIVAAVAVPVLTGVGVQPLAAHMFCLFYACLSNITPPVAMSSYVAAGIARSNETKTSLIAMRLGLTGFILPFFFLNNPLLLYSPGHSGLATLWAFITAALGVSALAAGLEGWLFTRCNPAMRAMLLAAAFLAIDPGLITDAVGLGLICTVCVWNWYVSRAQTSSGE